MKGSQAFQHILISGIKKEEHHHGDPREILQSVNNSEVSPTNTRERGEREREGSPRVGATGNSDSQFLHFIPSAYQLVF